MLSNVIQQIHVAIILVVQLRKLRFREVEIFAQGHIAGRNSV